MTIVHADLTNSNWQEKRYSIRWQTFGVISLVLASLVLVFSLLMLQWNEQQFEFNRSVTHDHYEKQLGRLIESSADKVIQLANAASLNKSLMEAVRAGDPRVILNEVEALDWNLQADAGLSVVGLYDASATALHRSDVLSHEKSVDAVLLREQPLWRIDCTAFCQIYTYTAMLYQGGVAGVLILAEPLSNVMLRFQHVAGIDTVLLGAPVLSDGKGLETPFWEKELIALTNPDENKAILNQASQAYSLDQLSREVQLLDLDQKTYALKAMSIEQSQVLVISNVSEDYSLLDETQLQTFKYSFLALLVGEVCLLFFLRQPLRRISRASAIEGLVSEQSTMLVNHARALNHAQSFSDSLKDSIAAGVLILDSNGFISSANHYFRSMVGMSSEQLKKVTLSDVVASDNAFLSMRLQDLAAGIIADYEHIGCVQSASGHVHKLVWRYVPIYSEIDRPGTSEGRNILVSAMPLPQLTSESERDWLDSHDSQTGVFNRNGLESLLETALESNAARSSTLFLVRIPECWTSHAISQLGIESSEACSLARLELNELAILLHSKHKQACADFSAQLTLTLQKLKDSGSADFSYFMVGVAKLHLSDKRPLDIIQQARDNMASKA